MNLNNDYMSYEERNQIIADIKKVYPGSSRWSTILFNMPENQLLAFRQNLTNTRKLNGNMNREIGIHINVIMNMFSAKDYMAKQISSDICRIYVGRHMNEKDSFGNPVNIQYGYIEVDNDYRILEMEMCGDKHKRYIGMRLNFPWNTFE